MAWLESHGNLARHPKTRRLMRRMGWTLPATIGNLHLLWWWTLEYAPTGDLTKFEPEQLTCDLDLGNASPEQFIDAMIYAGFIDRIDSGSTESRSGGTMTDSGFMDRGENSTLRIHDWPDYTGKSLRPKFRRDPDRWHRVLRSYNRPIPPRRNPSVRREFAHESPRHHVPAPELAASTHASRGDQMGMKDLRAGPRVSTQDTVTPPEQATARQLSPSADRPSDGAAAQPIEIPQPLAAQPGFTLTWWPKFLAVYKTQGYPLNAYEQTQALAKLAEHPSKAVDTLKHSVNTLTVRPELIKPGRGGTQPIERKHPVEDST